MTFAGISPHNPNKYVGPYVYYPSVVLRNRPPNGADFRQPETGKYYPVASYWIVGVNPTSGTQGDLWYLSKIVANVAFWVQLNGGGGGSGLLTVTVDAITSPGVNPVTIDSFNNMTIEASGVANHAVPIETHSRALHAFKTEVQYSTVAVSSTANLNGISHYNSTQFSVDANGFVSLVGGNHLTPNSIINLIDDFIGSVDEEGAFFLLNGSLSWSLNGQWQRLQVLDNGHPGIIGNKSIGGVGAANFVLSPTNAAFFSSILPMELGGGQIQLNWVVKIATLSSASPRYILRIGMGDTFTSSNGDQVNGVYFEYSDNINSGNWVCKTSSSSTRTTVNSAIAVTSGWHNLGIVIDATAASISFTIDGVSAGSAITTHIPTSPLTIFVKQDQTVGITAANSILLDLMYMQQSLTNAR